MKQTIARKTINTVRESLAAYAHEEDIMKQSKNGTYTYHVNENTKYACWGVRLDHGQVGSGKTEKTAIKAAVRQLEKLKGGLEKRLEKM